MRRRIEEFFSDEERASNLILSWMVAVGATSFLVAVSAILIMR